MMVCVEFRQTQILLMRTLTVFSHRTASCFQHNVRWWIQIFCVYDVSCVWVKHSYVRSQISCLHVAIFSACAIGCIGHMYRCTPFMSCLRYSGVRRSQRADDFSKFVWTCRLHRKSRHSVEMIQRVVSNSGLTYTCFLLSVICTIVFGEWHSSRGVPHGPTDALQLSPASPDAQSAHHLPECDRFA